MAEADSEAPAKPEAKDTDDVHAEALKQYERGYNRDRDNQSAAYDDLKFLADENQWDEKARKEREAEGRPILVVNKCSQFVRQVTGDMRQLRPAIKVTPIDEAGDDDVASKVLPSLVRYIEQRSDAKGIYFSAADSQVAAGIGHWRVLTEYASNTTFNQEIRIAPIEDGVAVVWDPDSVLPTRSDAKFCFVPVDMSRAAFEEKYPGKRADPMTTNSEVYVDWCSDDHVRVAEYFRKVAVKREIAQAPDGRTFDLTDMDDAERADVMALQPKVEERDGWKVERYIISAGDICEGPEDIPGPHIPVVPLLGEEIKIGRKVVRRGVIRALKDVQRIQNYAVSSEVEIVALQPKAPFKGTHKNFEKYIDQWETANSKNWPFLEYEPDPANGGKAPEREPPPAASVGLKDLIATSTADMSAVTGIYPASLGASSNESSGRAIMARQREGDTGTYVYHDNFARALQRTGQIIIDMVPYVYDTERTIRIAGEDGKIDKVEINKEQIDPNGDGIATLTLHDLTNGAYELAVEMGPSYATKREEAREGMTAFMQAAGPQVAQLYVDLFAKMQDWPLADKIAKRAHLMLPPPIQMAEAQESGEPPPPQMPPPPPTPEQQMEMQNQERQAALDAAKLQIDAKKIDAEMAKINAEIEKARIEQETAIAGHAASLKTAETTAKADVASAAVSQPDPRVDALAAAVEQLRDVVLQIADAIGGADQPQEQDAGAMPPVELPPAPPVDPAQIPGQAPIGA